MSSDASLSALASRLGHAFSDPRLLEQALTHRSCGARNNERLEFLGDAIIGMVIGEALYELRAGDDEGALSRLRASLVRERTLAGIARRLDIGSALRLGEGERKSGGWRRQSVLADALEAVAGAIYLDAGFAAVRAACRQWFAPELADLPDAESLKDAKTRLQEWLQARGRPVPVYSLEAESGPPHERVFEARVRVGDGSTQASASGSSRRAAEQSAAASLLARLAQADDKDEA